MATGCRADGSTTAADGAESLTFTADDLQFLQVFASQAATAVVNSGSFDQTSNAVGNAEAGSWNTIANRGWKHKPAGSIHHVM